MFRRAREGGMGYLAQESSVFRKLSVQNNLLGVMEMLGMNRKTRRRPRMKACSHNSKLETRIPLCTSWRTKTCDTTASNGPGEKNYDKTRKPLCR